MTHTIIAPLHQNRLIAFSHLKLPHSPKHLKPPSQLITRVVQEEAVATQTIDPFIDKTQYNDNFLDKLFIWYFCDKQSQQLGGYQSKLEGYDAFVDVSKQIVRGRNAMEQQQIVSKVLRSLMPEEAQTAFREWFPVAKWSCELNAIITTYFFKWLVGDMELKEVEIQKEDDTKEIWKSQVHIKKCRYIENSGCVGMCVNMCKIPTQKFFTEDLGLPLTMDPNFEDLSCEMVFGKTPIPIQEDPAFNQPCFNVCSIVSDSKDKPCPRLDGQPKL